MTVAAETVGQLWDLPDSWEWQRLSAVTDAPERGEPRTKFSDKFSYLDVSGIDAGSLSPRTIPVTDAPSRARQFLRPNDTVVSGVRVYLRNFAVIEEGGPEVASTAFCVLRPKQKIDPKYLFYWIESDQFIQRLLPLQRGNSPPAVLDADIRHQPIPVPPLAVQRKIVSRVHELLSEVGEGVGALAEASIGLDTYRKSLLKAAFSGHLTASWRAKNPPKIASDEYLKQILEDRKRAWAGDPVRSRRRYLEPVAPNTEALRKLPDGWTWASLQQVAFISGGITVDQKRKPNDPLEVPYLRVANVQRGYIDLQKIKTIQIERAELDSLALKSGDILLNEGGDRDKVGRGWIWEGQLPVCIHQNHVFKARPSSTAICPPLVSLYLNEMGRRFFIDEGKQTTNLASISLSKIAKAPVPIPPPDEATEILRAIANVSNSETEQSKILQSSISASATLRQSILNAAFRGELVT